MVHKRFIDAGVTDITTNTYHASVYSLQDQGLDGYELIKVKAVELLKDTLSTYHAGSELRVWGAIGSYAVCFRGQAAEYEGVFVDILPPIDIMKVMITYHQNEIEAMKAAGVHDLLFETISSVKEADAICEALKSYDDINTVISFTCRQNSVLLRHGETLESALRILLNSKKVHGFGINCTDPGTITTLLESVHDVGEFKEIFVYPNNGKFELYKSEEEPLKMVLNSIERWVELGVTVIGGCCGFDAEDIREISKKVQNLNICKDI
ncbi:homocysteine S-methyltransferase [Dictyocaulus viviparus]|uniref:Homocysteine S-methyltransferase n=1 Tax=Dictyocaulus viviparus TaxID=29172 RepID=A0A0D8X9P9_DICVI|nr:homocysteine S-methyltransferase [Dictyocaulus viviparus]